MLQALKYGTQYLKTNDEQYLSEFTQTLAIAADELKTASQEVSTVASKGKYQK
ncbi:hypothetical protein [Alicyclobacillus sp. SO9]|uniref:hypothetical protein n=1 Tax=Alicyclobacillus sp. SO9 TaxID=2665646 RepID=UPI0018E7B498|nr:hypothetical protein [Alicyclobacillus sp. SO9]QQE77257.1 hypothetical protein GI364_14955 [Alicyclobacillus sp. SO9]